MNYSSSIIDSKLAILFLALLLPMYNLRANASTAVNSLISPIPKSIFLVQSISFGIFLLNYSFFKKYFSCIFYSICSCSLSSSIIPHLKYTDFIR